mmetsp:Transcript_4193/g.10320  ORF Transcript_4193/g.10320 Transcript_4193/m.10320 type:complete len:387 (-) Transcript_4193:519-1679(-)
MRERVVTKMEAHHGRGHLRTSEGRQGRRVLLAQRSGGGRERRDRKLVRTGRDRRTGGGEERRKGGARERRAVLGHQREKTVAVHRRRGHTRDQTGSSVAGLVVVDVGRADQVHEALRVGEQAQSAAHLEVVALLCRPEGAQIGVSGLAALRVHQLQVGAATQVVQLETDQLLEGAVAVHDRGRGERVRVAEGEHRTGRLLVGAARLEGGEEGAQVGHVLVALVAGHLDRQLELDGDALRRTLVLTLCRVAQGTRWRRGTAGREGGHSGLAELGGGRGRGGSERLHQRAGVAQRGGRVWREVGRGGREIGKALRVLLPLGKQQSELILEAGLHLLHVAHLGENSHQDLAHRRVHIHVQLLVAELTLASALLGRSVVAEMRAAETGAA